MNILMLTRDMELGGISTCIKEYSELLIEKGHRVYICAREGAARHTLPPEVSFYHVVFGGESLVPKRKILHQLYRLVKQEKIDIIHCHTRRTTLYAGILHILTGVDYIWQDHGLIRDNNNKRINRLLARCGKYYGKQAIAISQERFNFMKEKIGIPESKITKIENGIRVERYQRRSEEECRVLREKYGIRPGEKTIVLFGRLGGQKGHSFLLDAVKDLPGDYKVLLTGEGTQEYRRELEEQIGRLGLTERVIFTGNVAANDILSISDVMVLPSIFEGFPIAALEAMALRVPIVRTKTGGYEDMQDCVDGVDYGDTATLTALLQKNLEHGPEIQQRVDYAYEKLMERWDVRAVVDRYLEVYQL